MERELAALAAIQNISRAVVEYNSEIARLLKDRSMLMSKVAKLQKALDAACSRPVEVCAQPHTYGVIDSFNKACDEVNRARKEKEQKQCGGS